MDTKLRSSGAEEALRESEEKFSAAFRASPIALVIATLDGKYVEMNQAFCNLLGYSREELLGKTAVDIGIFNAETRQEWAKAVERAGGVMTNVEFTFRLPNGISRTTLFSAETITFHGVPHRLTTMLDITERKRSDQALRESEQRYHALVDQIPAIVYIDDVSKNPGTTKFVNSYIKTALGFTPEEWISGGYDFWMDVIHPDDHAQVLSEYERFIQSGQPFEREYRVIAKGGRLVWLRDRSTLWTDEEGRPLSMHGIAYDITESKQAEAERERLYNELSKSHEQLKIISSRLAEIQESERRQLARELHDEFGQSLTALKMDLAWLHDHLPPRSKSLHEKVDSALTLTNETIQMTQRLASQLRPRMLDDLGLAAALEWHVSEWSKRTRIKTKVNLPEEEWQLNPSLNTALYRVCQEALTNVARHAGASKVEVSLVREVDEVVLTVRDNGCGIDGGKITSPESLGLLGMKERVEQIGGKLEIQSKMGKETIVVARVPISQPSSYHQSRAASKESGQAKKSLKGKRSRIRKS